MFTKRERERERIIDENPKEQPRVNEKKIRVTCIASTPRKQGLSKR
jgi:hypothetical protein